MCSDAPDTSGLNAAAKMSSETAAKALEWYMAKDAEAKPLRDEAAKTAIDVAKKQGAAMDFALDQAKDLDEYNKTTFRPLEKQIVSEAQNYDTAERRTEAATSAMADVNKAFAGMNEASARRLAAEGVDPGSARAMSIMQSQGVDQAVANAGAAFKARKGVEMTGHAMKMDAASLGRGIASAQTAAVQTGVGAGTAAVGSANTPVNNANAGAATYGQGFGTAIQGYGTAGNLYGKAAELSATSDGLWGAVGSLGGAAISAFGPKLSDRTVKTEIEPTDPERALREVRATPVADFKYDPAKLAARGIEPERYMKGEQTGPMAQDVAATMGEEASNGERIAPDQIMGKTLAAVKALDKRVTQLAKMIGAGQIQAEAA